MASLLKYPGAKWALASWIVRYLPETPHYVEPFCGSAAVYFNLPWRPRHAVLNDLSGDIVNLFRVIRERGDELAALIEMTPWAREEHESAWQPTESPTEQARRFLVRTWQMHALGNAGGKRAGWKTGGLASGASSTTRRWGRLPADLLATVDALRQAEIERRPALDVIARHRAADVLIYADPPYVTEMRRHRLYAHEMSDADHVALLDALDAHPGPVALSGYACALYDDRLPHWRRVETQARAEGAQARTECLWLNPALQERLRILELFNAA